MNVVGSGVRFALGGSLPDVQNLSLTAMATGRTVAVQAPRGSAELGKGLSLQLTDGSFGILDTYAERPIGRAGFRATGGVDALAALMALPALKDAAPGQIDPEGLKGRVDLRTELSLPLVENIKASDVVVQSTGQITGLASETMLGGPSLEAANLAANYDRGQLNLKGDGRINGALANIELKQDAKGVGEVIVAMTLDPAARQKFGVELPAGLTGPVGIRAVQPLGRAKSAPLRVEADLTRMAIDGLLPGWTKPAGRAGRMTFQLADASGNRSELTEIALDAPPVMARGRAMLDENGGLVSASLSQFRLSPGDDLRVEARRDGPTTKLTVRGRCWTRGLSSSRPPPRRPRAVARSRATSRSTFPSRSSPGSTTRRWAAPPSGSPSAGRMCASSTSMAASAARHSASSRRARAARRASS